MFGDEKLLKIYRENGDKSPEELKNKILESLKSYELNDEVTLVVFKRV